MKHPDLWESIKRAAITYAINHRGMCNYSRFEFIEDIRLDFIAGVEDKKPLRIRHTRTHVEMSEME